MSVKRLLSPLFLTALGAATFVAAHAPAAIIVFDDFNVDEGRFASAPSFSGSNANIAASSTADRITSDSLEGAGSQQLVINTTTPGNATRLRFLSGVGTPANNLTFATSAATDGWIGLALKTDSPGWTVQLWVEPSTVAPAATGHNGGVPKDVVADGQWHIYQWNLDDHSGGPDGWGSIAGIIGGVATVGDGNHTIDSVIFRHAAGPATATILMDWVVRDDAGRIVPEAGTLGLAGLASLALAAVRRRRV